MISADLVLSGIKSVLFRELTLHTFSGKVSSGHFASDKWSCLERQMAGPNQVQGGLHLRSDVVKLPYWRLEHFLLSHGEIR